MTGEEPTEYERMRIENIKRNEELLASLNIKAKLSDLSAFSKCHSGSGNELVVKRKRGRPKKYGPMSASLVSTTPQKNRGRPSGALSIAAPGSGSGSGNELVVKRKRGRPRKYGPMPASLVASSDPVTTTPQKNRGRPSGSLSIATPGSGSGSGNELVVKRKRGRPRKYRPMPASLVASSDPSTTTPQKKRGRPRGSGKKQQVADVAVTQIIYDQELRRSLRRR